MKVCNYKLDHCNGHRNADIKRCNQGMSALKHGSYYVFFNALLCTPTCILTNINANAQISVLCLKRLILVFVYSSHLI
jgi:hypothetical protein